MTWYDQIKKLAKKRAGLSIKDFLAMSPGNDPFYVGSKGQMLAAQWVADIYQKWRERTGKRVLHIRRLHYYLVSLENIIRPTSPPTPYMNTDACWNYLVQAVKNARYLGLIPMSAIEDRKNERRTNSRYWTHDNVQDTIEAISADSVADAIAEQFYLYNPQIEQPYHLEIWVEKDTMNDVLTPIARRYGADMVVGEGEISLTQVSLLMAKVGEIQKATRIFYISDFDPKGRDMPISISRKIEWYIRSVKEYADLDVKLIYLMLTKDQCLEYGLPRTPIKKGEGVGSGAKAYDTRTRRFEARHGKGATELDALEALHPGEMRRVVKEAIDPYFDEDLAYTIQDKNREIRGKVKDTVLHNKAELTGLLEEMDFSEVEEICNEFEIPQPEVDDIDEGTVLFDSQREYAEQLGSYRTFQGSIKREG